MRWLRHLVTTRWHLRRSFPPRVLDAIEAAVTRSEQRHRGELRVVVEAALDLPELVAGITARQRALRVFAELGVWDTHENNGVLVYLLVAERAVEIVADRGYTGRVAPEAWRAACAHIVTGFQANDPASGFERGIDALTALMASAFPGDGRDPNELPNRPHLL